MESSPKENYVLAAIWLALSFVVATAGIYVLFSQGKYLAISFLGLSLLLFYVGKQRLDTFRLEPEKFQRVIRKLGLFIAISAAVGGLISANI